MARHLPQIDYDRVSFEQLERLANFHPKFARKAGQKAYFGRTYKKLSSKDQQMLDHIIEKMEKGEDLVLFNQPQDDPQIPQKNISSSRVKWSGREWDHLASLVIEARKNKPELNLIQLVNSVMENFPQERRRKIASFKLLEELKIRIKKMEQSDSVNIQSLQKEIEELKKAKGDAEALNQLLDEELKKLSKESIISSLTQEEINSNFAHRINQDLSEVVSNYSSSEILEHIPVRDLMSFAIGTVVQFFSNQNDELINSISKLNKSIGNFDFQNNRMSVPMPRLQSNNTIDKKLPKILLFGFLPMQGQEVDNQLKEIANFVCVNKNRHTAISGQYDIIVALTSKISHADFKLLKTLSRRIQAKFIPHEGGVTSLITNLKRELIPQQV